MYRRILLLAPKSRGLSNSILGDHLKLNLVLRAFRLAPFEHLKKASLKYLTMRLTFLLALATDTRRSEIHVLTYDILAWNKNKTCYFIQIASSFVSCDTVSRWIKDAILYTHETCSLENINLSGVKAHQVRAIFATKVFHKYL